MEILRRAWSIDWAPAAAMLAVLALATVALFPPGAQDFPLNDDWSYSRGAFAFARGEGIQYNGWASMPLLGMWLVAWPFIQIFGESHLALRFVTLTFSIVGLASLSVLLRDQGVATPLRRLAVLTLAAYPVVLLLTGTFMSDIPGLALSLASLALFVRAFRLHRLRLALLAVLVTCFGTITRQTVCLAGLAAFVWALLDKDALDDQMVGLRRWLLPFLALVPVAFAFAVEAWFHTRDDALIMHPVVPSAGRIALVVVFGAFTCGLACIPVLVAQRRSGGGRLLALLLIACAGMIGFYVASQGNLPFLGNTLTRFGVFFENDLMLGQRQLIVPRFAALALVAVGVIGMAALLAGFFARLHASLKQPLVIFSLLHLVLIPIAPVFVDRYFVPLLPGAIAIACGGEAVLSRLKMAFACAGAFALFGWLVYIDWLSWNKARWDLGRRAVTQMGISPTDIEGGFEWDGWHSSRAKSEPRDRAGLMLPLQRDNFPEFTGRYGISFSPLPDTRVLASEPWTSPFPPFKRQMVLVTAE